MSGDIPALPHADDHDCVSLDIAAACYFAAAPGFSRGSM
jgi:hypothetical protein